MNGMGPFERLQDLPARAAQFCLAVERFCRNERELDFSGASPTSLVVAYSGGADSKALLLALHFLAPRMGLALHAATLDHGLRAESTVEVAEAAALCARLNVRFHTGRRDVAAFASDRGIGLEEAGRLERISFLETVRETTGSAWIATGHHLNDVAEDCLMRMTRGTGWPALAGMAAVVPEKRVIRPLLLTPRESIERFLLDLGETWVHDAMNEDDAYFRNRVRNHILPLFIRENPAFLETVADRWRMARADAAFFRSALAGVAEEKRGGEIFLSRGVLRQMPPSLRLRKYREILGRLGGPQVAATRVFALDAAWERNEGGKFIQFPGGRRAAIRDGGILFLRNVPS